jgi:hypothetical protein
MLYKDLHAFLRFRVTGWGIPSRGIPAHPQRLKRQILATAPELLRYEYIS